MKYAHNSLLFILAACMGCGGPPSGAEPPSSDTASHHVGIPATNRDAGDLDDQFMELAEAIPGFAGLYMDASGGINIRMTAVGRRDLARQELFNRLPKRVSDRLAQAEFVDARYDFTSLYQWKHLAIENLDEFTSIDIDEVENILRIGVPHERARGAVFRILVINGVPPDAVIVSIEQPPVTLTTLSDFRRPILGGMNIQYRQSNSSPPNECTLGINVLQGGQRYFVTNAHCTLNPYGFDGGIYYQPTLNTIPGNWRIGQEYKDPPSYCCTSSCSSRCRRSDSALIKYDSLHFGAQGFIARTTYVGTGSTPGSRVIDPVNPSWAVHGTWGNPFAGEVANKVGNNTGWAQGPTVATCVLATPVGGPRLTCQYRVAAPSGPGDSGSPVFVFTDQEPGAAAVVGIVWGMPCAPGTMVCSSFWMSPMSGVQSDLGIMSALPPL